MRCKQSGHDVTAKQVQGVAIKQTPNLFLYITSSKINGQKFVGLLLLQPVLHTSKTAIGSWCCRLTVHSLRVWASILVKTSYLCRKIQEKYYRKLLFPVFV